MSIPSSSIDLIILSKSNDVMTEILANDDEPIETLNDESNHRTIIPSVVVVEPTTKATPGLDRKDSIVIPSISNSSISSAIQFENNNTNTLLPVCTSNSLGKY